MNLNTLLVILEDIAYPLTLLLLLAGLFVIILGAKQFREGFYGEEQVLWYNFPMILNGIAAISLALFFALFITSIRMPNFLIAVLMDIIAIVFGGLFILCLIRASRYASFLKSKRRQLKQINPKD